MESLARMMGQVEVLPENFAQRLQGFCEDVERLHPISCHSEVNVHARLDNSEALTQLFHIIRRAALNSITHGRADSITILVEGLAQQVRATVEDDGVGLPPDFDPVKGTRLRVMIQRAAKIGAKLEILPAPTRGVLVVCTVPLSSLQKNPGLAA